MAEAPYLKCAGCGKPPPEGGHHPRCPLCAENNMLSTYFYCQDCPAEPWPEHKAWHKEVDARREDGNTGGVRQRALPSSFAGRSRASFRLQRYSRRGQPARRRISGGWIADGGHLSFTFQLCWEV